MAKTTLDDYVATLETGQTFTVALPDGDELDLTLRSPSRAAAERVAERISASAAEDGGVDLGATIAAVHEALAACCPEIPDVAIPRLAAAGGQELQKELFRLCGIGEWGGDGDDPGNSPSATS